MMEEVKRQRSPVNKYLIALATQSHGPIICSNVYDKEEVVAAVRRAISGDFLQLRLDQIEILFSEAKTTVRG
jgi:hypothetical protein